MANIYLDSDNIQSAITKLSDSINTLNKAKSIASSLYIPDFEQSSYLNDMSSLLTECVNDCDSDIAFLQSGIQIVNNKITESKTFVSKCTAYNVVSKEAGVNLIK